MAVNCGRCRAVDRQYACGWCLSTQSCSTQQRCAAKSWISRTQLCPDPAVTQVCSADQRLHQCSILCKLTLRYYSALTIDFVNHHHRHPHIIIIIIIITIIIIMSSRRHFIVYVKTTGWLVITFKIRNIKRLDELMTVEERRLCN